MSEKNEKKSALMTVAVFFLLLCLMLPVMASGTEPTSFDYGNSSIEGNRTLSGAELLSMVYGIETGNAEREYLLTQSQFDFTYSDLIPSSFASTEYNGEEGTLKLSVLPYTFIAANGVTVEWIPKKAVIEEQILLLVLDGEEYCGTFENLFRSEDYDMQILFEWQVCLPEALCKELLNDAYQMGNEALAKVLSYEAALAIYNEQLKAYEVYEAYLTSVENYEDYQTKLSEYEALKLEYDAYLVQYEEYQTVLNQYQTWRDYWTYVKAEAEYPEKRKAYLEYDAEVQKVKNTLAVIESLFAYDSHHWQHYVSLQGNLVASVLSNKDKFVTAGCDPKHIDAAGASTELLRPLMKGYADLRKATYASDHDRYTALYTYYVQHYAQLRDGYQALYGSLMALYSNNIVVEALRQEGKLEHFQQFVGQLYLTAVCLDDAQAPSESWRIGKRTLADVLEQVNMVTDGDYADPTQNGVAMPATEVENVEVPVPVEKPDYDDPRVPPKAPTVVTEPKKPENVEPPSDVAPPEAKHPGDAPQAPVLDPLIHALMQDVRNGKLNERGGLVAKALTFEKSVICPVSITNVMTVTFYDVDGATVFDRQTVEYGSAVEYQGAYPMRAPSERYYYTEFIGWIEATGEPADLSCVTKNRSVYASYKTEDRYYSVKWQIEGQLPITTKHLYGVIPVYPNSLNKASDERYTYTFSGWDREIVGVSEDTVYYGSFIQTPREYTVTWNIEGVIETEIYRYGDFPQYKGDIPQKTPDTYIYRFSDWIGETDNTVLGMVTKDITYCATFRKNALASSPDGELFNAVWSEESITVIASSDTVIFSEALKAATERGIKLIIQWGRVSLVLDAEAQALLQTSTCKRIQMKPSETEFGMLYTLRYLTSLGNDTSLALPATLRFDGSEMEGEYANFYIPSNGGSDQQQFEEIPIVGSLTTEVRLGFSLYVEPIKGCDLASLPEYAEVGQVVDLNLTCTFGYEVSEAIVTTADGRRIEVNGMRFVMPREAVHISLTISKIVYRVTFKVNGSIYHTAEYGLGEEIALPQTPALPADAQYAYTFLSWSPNVTIAAGAQKDMVFEAQFSKISLKNDDPYKLAGNSNRLLTIVLPMTAGITALGLLLWIILRKKKEKKNTDKA